MTSVAKEFVSKLGTNLRLTVKATDGHVLEVIVDRRVIDKQTGEVRVEQRTRTVRVEDWRYVIAGYVPSRKT